MRRLCIHTITTKPWTTEECISRYAAAGVGGITFWRYNLEGRNPAEVGRQAREAGLDIVSLCRGGFFPSASAEGRRKAIDDNRRCIEEAQALGAPLIVLVCGAVPGQSLEESRKQIADGIEAILPDAEAAGVKLGIEPLHPMYADDRSAVNTMRQANDICDALGSPEMLGIAADVYHIWWDPELKHQIEFTAAQKRLFAFHICDWKTPTMDFLNDRGLMGEGCIPIRQISDWVDATGYKGTREVEIFSNRYWAMDQDEWLKKITEAYHQLYV
ncbi:sugar phosphate isomerase/epimerase family protein [Prosthecobacter dejongeii]|uniref:Sugar phosphate isomerase/epimerase n=1 Tax=Prosthecobacter dejongeii TaxID=48465 RepID=A0A7W7YKZ2_9BACT|nr:sugar phosphate isomerase/epimerase family protein [Prosthecobacter dejongeii]MBB5038153.1 sugar phosphate isomerase/epimerase [Prosthecobacter dejongeii]